MLCKAFTRLKVISLAALLLSFTIILPTAWSQEEGDDTPVEEVTMSEMVVEEAAPAEAADEGDAPEVIMSEPVVEEDSPEEVVAADAPAEEVTMSEPVVEEGGGVAAAAEDTTTEEDTTDEGDSTIIEDDAEDGVDSDEIIDEIDDAGGDVVDYVFTIDTTASMTDDIEAVQEAATEIVDAVDASGDDYRIAIVTYRDYPERTGDPEDYPSRVELEFTDDTGAIIEAIDNLDLGFGGDYPETVYSGLNEAAGLDFREGADRVIILIGDAPPLDPEPVTGFTIEETTEEATSTESVVYVVAVAPLSSDELDDLAAATGGAVIPVDAAGDVPGAIVAVIEGSVDEFIASLEDDDDDDDDEEVTGVLTTTETVVILGVPVSDCSVRTEFATRFRVVPVISDDDDDVLRILPVDTLYIPERVILDDLSIITWYGVSVDDEFGWVSATVVTEETTCVPAS